MGGERIFNIEQRISELRKYQVVNIHIIGVTKGEKGIDKKYLKI